MVNGSAWTHDDELDAEVLTVTIGDWTWTGAVTTAALISDPATVTAAFAESAAASYQQYADNINATPSSADDEATTA